MQFTQCSLHNGSLHNAVFPTETSFLPKYCSIYFEQKKKEAFKRKFKLNILHQASYIFHFPLEATTNATRFPSVYGYNHTKHAISKKGSKPNFMQIQIEKTVEIEQHRRITRQQWQNYNKQLVEKGLIQLLKSDNI